MAHPDAMTGNYEPQREPDDNDGGVIYKIGRGAKWVVPLTAISAAVVSITRLAITPAGWLREVSETADDVVPLDPDPIVCLALSAVTLTYWLSRDGWESILRLFAMFKYAVADREERQRIARQAHARGRTEGLSEGRSEGLSEGRRRAHEAQARIKSWWEEATKGGTQPPSLDNPPPLVDTDGNESDGGSA